MCSGDVGELRRAESAAARTGAAAVSILIPFYGDDPCPLLGALAAEAARDRRLLDAFEIILFEDGASDRALTERVALAVANAGASVRLVSSAVNRGRSEARNRLVGEARANRLLFLDADMLPDAPGFLARWLAVVERDDPAIAFGGISVAQAAASPGTALHRAFQAGAECPEAAERALAPAKYVYTSNLLVRRELLAAEPFDNGFVGWGWEDVEWAARAGTVAPILHVDNPASHLGLQSADALLEKFARSAANFARFAARHPEFARALPSWKAARLFQSAPVLHALRPAFAWVARNPRGLAPMKARVLALKLWRASWYGAAL